MQVPDPYLGGADPARRGCIEGGECMGGCRHNAKNTLLKNYCILRSGPGPSSPLTTVTRVPLRDGGYAVDIARTRTWRPRNDGRTFTAGQVVFAAGAWGTQQLLHRMRSQHTLPRISDRLGVLTRTNSEALAGAMVRRRSRAQPDFTRGVAITSSIHPDAQTHIEPCRYGKGSSSMGLLTTVMTDGGGRLPRWPSGSPRSPGTQDGWRRSISAAAGPNAR